MNKNYRIFIQALFLTFVIMLMGTTYIVLWHYMDVRNDKQGYIHFQDQIIVPNNVIGLQLKEWPVAYEDCSESIYEVQVILNGQTYSRGPVFDSRDKAERVMIWLANECGL